MEQTNAPMMGRIAEIENLILSGFVLDDRGNWVSIADKKTAEEDFLVHLEAGHVLHNERWTNITDAKKQSRAIPENAMPAPFGTENVLMRNAAGDSAAENQYPLETKAMKIKLPMAEIEETNIDTTSGYAMETGLFIIDRPQETGPAPEGETKRAKKEAKPPATSKALIAPQFIPPVVPTWEKEEPLRKRRTIIISGAIVAIAGIAAIAVIVLQIFH